ncbi:MAG: hypothetical protein JSW60_02135 [Thermoplasmatales archaeon]|nr:MAG: hypothetical protein JSW60_02135 [Thermoplasmatales archaeon]
MNKKILSIVVCMLMFVTASSVTGAINIEKDNNLSLITKPASTGIFWEDNFDNYSLGPLHGQGGWEAWDDNPATTGYVTDNQSRSPDNSAEIDWFGGASTDIVYQFSGVSSGNWTLTAWQYVPSDMEGSTDYLLLNTYNHGGPYHWSLQLFINATRIWDYNNVDDWLPIVNDDWAEIRVEIDFEADIQKVYYDGEFLLEKSWTEGVRPGGAKNLGCIDLYGGQTYSSSVYYDDFVLEGEAAGPDLHCEGNLVWTNVSRGATLTGNFTVKNVGGTGTELDWDITKTPSWGTWTFDPDGGENLKPEDGPVTVDVTCVAPNQKNEEFIGKITIENLENSEDTCTIDVDLTTPMNKATYVFQFLQNILQRFPILARIISSSPFFS